MSESENCQWRYVDGPDNAYHCGNNRVSTIQKNNDVMVISQSNYHQTIYIRKINGVAVRTSTEGITSTSFQSLMDEVLKSHQS
jgi:hypothetical protein